MTIALDLFAGTGWGVACKRLDIEEHGAEIMPAAISTRDAAGMLTPYRDVWDLFGVTFDYDMHIASPPCQTFSMAGSGAGRQALDTVLGLIETGAYRDVEKLRAFGEKYDARTALVLTPLALAMRDLPRVIIWEQVPPVLPVWEACARVLRSVGYSVVTGVFNAEEYGVPQTRRRAILIARWDREARMPTPTHNRYRPRVAGGGRWADEGLLPWVSMADALEWGMTERPYMTVAAGTASGGTDPAYLGGSGARAVVKGERDAGRWVLRSNYSTTASPGAIAPEGSKLPRTECDLDQPATTITSKYPRWVARKRMGRGMVERYGERPGRELDQPAFTIRANAGGTEPHGFRWEDAEGGEEPIRLTDAEAACLQSYPAGFPWQGNRGDVAQQIGNAVPPLLAEAILREVMS